MTEEEKLTKEVSRLKTENRRLLNQLNIHSEYLKVLAWVAHCQNPYNAGLIDKTLKEVTTGNDA